MVDLVRQWFGQAEKAAGPLLPDGWFGGRAYENQFSLSDVRASGTTLIIHLSYDTTLTFDHPHRVFVDEKSELVFEGFDEAILRWKYYGGAEYCERRYGSGQVRLVPPLGRQIKGLQEPVSTRCSIHRDESKRE